MGKIRDIIHLLRIRQYYKNFLIFVGIFFSGNLFQVQMYDDAVFGFILSCLTSSIIYVINDITDIEEDRLHPEKLNKKPLANGNMNLISGILILVLLILIVISGILFINVDIWPWFAMLVITGLLYNFIFKKIAFADIIILGFGYIWRALIGVFIIDQELSEWMVMVVFLSSLLLALGKRRADLVYLSDEKAINHKKSYNVYSVEVIDQILTITATSVFVTYSLYCVIGSYNPTLIFSAIIGFFLIIRFLYLVRSNPAMGRNPEKLLKDPQMIIAGLVMAIFVGIIIYYDHFFN